MNKANNLNETLKAREAAERSSRPAEGGVIALDDTQRVKVLSPGRLVSKRFFRNKLALVGLAILIFMFVFSFLGPIFYPYGQKDIFFKYSLLSVDYAVATERNNYVCCEVDPETDVHYSIVNAMTSYVNRMESEGLELLPVTDNDGKPYLIEKLGDYVYTASDFESEAVAEWSADRMVGTLNSLTGEVDTEEELPAGFVAAAKKAIKDGTMAFKSGGLDYTVSPGPVKVVYNISCSGGDSLIYSGRTVAGLDEAFFEAKEAKNELFTHKGKDYVITVENGVSTVSSVGETNTALVASVLVLDAVNAGESFSEEFRGNALLALYGDGGFTADGEIFTIAHDSGSDYVLNESGEQIAMISTVAVRRYSGEDNFDLDFKAATAEKIAAMEAAGQQTGSFVYPLQELDETSKPVYDENGKPKTVDTELTVTLKLDRYVLTCEQTTHLIDIYAPPSDAHPFGTDADGMDILARMMYGGRISLMVGFVVVILESILGTLMGGIAGYFGGWLDTLIMRLVDIFYCIPTYPILIIMGAFFDSIKLGSYWRLVWMMVIMGILGWASIARLVRGQILSLREQEFMVAAEATGISTGRRIFKHLVPNVMPQLIVSATMGLGNVIIMESTLSFLGLGVKHPLATWGTMINSITSSNENLVRYAYIWIPVGLLICLTVIAFNFVGDGLRDAFDPKMKQ